MDKDFPEETKTNLFLEKDSEKETKNINPDEEVEDNDNETYNSLEEYFLDCCRDGDKTEFIDCIQSNVDVLTIDRNLNNALHMICANGHKHLLEEMIKIINEKFPKEKENIINHKNCDGNTPLHWAAINSKMEIISILLDNKCDCSIKNIFGKTPLDEALHLGFDNIAEIVAPHTKMDLEEFDDLDQESCEVKEVNSDEEEDLNKINKN